MKKKIEYECLYAKGGGGGGGQYLIHAYMALSGHASDYAMDYLPCYLSPFLL